VRRDAVPLTRPFRMQREAGVHAGVPLRDRRPVGVTEPDVDGTGCRRNRTGVLP
jgi:hypothetical protein